MTVYNPKKKKNPEFLLGRVLRIEKPGKQLQAKKKKTKMKVPK